MRSSIKFLLGYSFRRRRLLVGRHRLPTVFVVVVVLHTDTAWRLAGAEPPERGSRVSATAEPTSEPTAEPSHRDRRAYALTRTTEAPSYAPTTDTYAPTGAPTVTAAPTQTDAPTGAPTTEPTPPPLAPTRRLLRGWVLRQFG